MRQRQEGSVWKTAQGSVSLAITANWACVARDLTDDARNRPAHCLTVGFGATLKALGGLHMGNPGGKSTAVKYEIGLRAKYSTFL